MIFAADSRAFSATIVTSVPVLVGSNDQLMIIAGDAIVGLDSTRLGDAFPEAERQKASATSPVAASPAVGVLGASSA